MELPRGKETLATRNTIQFVINKPRTDKLKAWASKLPDQSRKDLRDTYGNLLNLLEVNVQIEAISALAQYYDPQLRCFTFTNFQLAPMLEEFALIVGQPLNDEKPYQFQGNYPRLGTVAKALKVHPHDLTHKKQNKVGEEKLEGISRSGMEELMDKLVEQQNWSTLVDVLALAIYDLILFPTYGESVGLGAVDVFMGRKCRKENSTFPILADVYYTLSLCYEENKCKIFCCLPALYVWLTSHVCPRNRSAACPFRDLQMARLPTHDDKEWKQLFIELKDKNVRWYPLGTMGDRVLVRCGEFPNVPLVGTLGCVNYNPTLALRQVRYPMMDPPAKDSLPHFRAELGDRTMLDKIRRAWKNVVYKGLELGTRSTGASDTYKEWVRNRVEEIKLPFRRVLPRPPQEIDTVMEECEEMQKMKERLARSEFEKGELEAELKKVRLTLEAMKLESSEKDQHLSQANKRARMEQKSRGNISAKNQELKEKIAQGEKTVKENERLKGVLGKMEQQVAALKIQIEKQEAQHESSRKFDDETYTEIIRGYQEHLEEKHLDVHKLTKEKERALEENWQLREEMKDLEVARAETQRRLVDLNLQMKETIALYGAQYEEKIRNIKYEFSGIIHGLRTTIEKKDEELRSLDNWAEERRHFLSLIRGAEMNFIEVWYRVAHWVHKLRDIRRIPELVRDAKAMINPLTMPREAIELIDVCQGLVETFKELVEQAKEDVAKEFVDLVG